MLDDLTAHEVVMLGHLLRSVARNAYLTGESAEQMGKPGLAMINETEAYKSLWSKVAEAIRKREDLEPFRTPSEPSEEPS